MSKANSPDPSAAATPSLNGAWFRRERERIAMGRKPLATRLAKSFRSESTDGRGACRARAGSSDRDRRSRAFGTSRA